MEIQDAFYAVPPSVDWLMAAPVLAAILTGVAGLLIEMLRPKRPNGPIVWTTLLGLSITAGFILSQFGLPDGDTFGGMVQRDRAGLVLQLMLVAICGLSVFFSEGYLREKRIPYAEFYPLAAWSTAGGMIMVGTTNLLMLFIGLEILSIALYVMCGLSRQEAKSEEAAIKYFLLGAFASGFLLYGIAFLFGATGGLELGGIARAWEAGDGVTQRLLLFGVGLSLVGFCFKSAFVPFHQWTPDVYQGSPTNVTAFMAAGSKVAAIGALYRFLGASISMRDFWLPALCVVAILTMMVGSLIALRQKDVKRALGYSAITNAGYVLVALLSHFAAPNKVGISTTLFYLGAYSLMTVGTFAVVSLCARGGQETTLYADLNGLSRRAPAAAGALLVLVISLIGIPLTGGFLGKFFILRDALEAGLTSLAVVLILSSAISLYYYVLILRAAWVDADDERRLPSYRKDLGALGASVLCAAGVVAAFLFSDPILRLIGL